MIRLGSTQRVHRTTLIISESASDGEKRQGEVEW